MMNRRLWAALGLSASTLVGCGGGGGGGGTSTDGGGTGVTDPSAPTFSFNTSVAGDIAIKTQGFMAEIVASGSGLLDMAQFTTDLVHRFAGPGSPASVTANCATTGHITLQFDDRDGNGYASAGDVITATLDHCGVPALRRSASGTLQVQVMAASPTVDVGMRAHLVTVDALQLAAAAGLNIGTIQSETLQGSLDVTWSESSTGSQLAALSSSADDLHFNATTFDGFVSPNFIRTIDVSRSVHYDTASISSTMGFLYDVGQRGGTLRVSSKQPFQGDLGVLPKQFVLEAAGAGGWLMRAERQQVVTGGVPVAYAVDPSGASSPYTMSLDWSQMLAPMTDTRLGPTIAYTDQGDAVAFLTSWRGFAYQSDIDRACQQGSTAGVTTTPYHADPLFQRPVAPQPSLTETGALVKLQFGRAIAADSPAFQFRFVDSTLFPDANFPNWNVSAIATRRGSVYEIRPAEPLRQGRTYDLQASADGGASWDGNWTLRDAQNQVFTQGTPDIDIVTTDTSLIASASLSDKATVAASAPARLRGSASLRDGQTVTAYAWTQISGVPLNLSTPTSADTDASLDGSTLQPVGDAVLQLTITDSLGNRDRIRVLVEAGNVVSQGAALYTQNKYGPIPGQPGMTTGPGSFFYGPSAGTVSPRVVGLSQGGTGVDFSVTPANGQALVLGTYADAVKSNTPGAQNGLISKVYCNTDGSPVTGSFQVLDLGYATDGTISRLAIDFVQQCQAGAQEFQRGSYRYNSTVPLTP